MGRMKDLWIDECNARGIYAKGQAMSEKVHEIAVDVAHRHDFGAMHVYTAKGMYFIEGEQYKRLTANRFITIVDVMEFIKKEGINVQS